MKLVSFVTSLLFLASKGSAYDFFQDAFMLGNACFPVYNHEQCNRTLDDSYGKLIKGAGDYPPKPKFFLFTPTSQEKAEQLHQCAEGLPPDSTFDVSCPTKVIVHGYADGLCRTAWMREMKEQLYLEDDCWNIIETDWSSANFPDIASAAANAKVVGQLMSYLLEKIARLKNYDCKYFHIIGHSFGVIVESYAAKFIQRYCKIGKLTGLDPALPPYKNSPEGKYLNPTDALFVDVVHTNAGDCFPFEVGHPRAMGHVDFYVNDGEHQYSCIPYALESIAKMDFAYAFGSIYYPALCFHLQSIQYYKVSILAAADNTQMIGVRCDNRDDWMSGKCERNCEIEDNCLPLGLDTILYYNTSADPCERKRYFVPTTLTCPYADHSGFTGLPLTPINCQDPTL